MTSNAKASGAGRISTIPAMPKGATGNLQYGSGETYTITAAFADGRSCSARFAYGTSADEVEAKWQRAVARVKALPSPALTTPDFAAHRRETESTAREVAKALRGSGVKANARKGVVRVTAKGEK